MSKSSFSWNKFKKAPIIGIIRGASLEDCIFIADAFSKAGLYTLEITMNTGKVLEIIPIIKERFPDLCIGAGTVCTMDELNQVIDAGADFIVTPIINEKVIEESVKKGIPIFPGAFSPTEIYKAWSLGATAVKLFPASGLTPQYIKDILAPLNNIKVIPTGGVNSTNIFSFFTSGATGVGMGSSLIDQKYVQNKNHKGLIEHFKRILSKHKFSE
ncbi:MAG: bifunctional 4-hydroxy-2-oxoglutarate aldolase/2-dehydro-3-deoxy-phosphogluconate aldolase [Wenyingzhuangia sp.]|jgi:2-dehydro-3-deoxyphosphogluconate aldolase/(4S)-4-hydroxy-2-oxoglutarate aldolase|uniref:bifunctional 4-hydroxy-2-oxoglutarate aldolase/2-dehydro-3-deoxy-phosphogluconate aldolase n=1 Tax=Wenyingzhuangia sp. TaxID=1964193 RepID=UPI00230B9CB1|nr:bifunctional 4-hydroxy-2-oxoglutarate aldolase/2-dehydro-3-deoxy-phosphogluconate aldolase [Flavobacteriaceae bacterium]MDA9330800.1 bifunctional 4-hydroxy-2-oxoglutarate aldolase/2-dehydro-3-deoxy-phosphogluconate aldolase [Flavobacteriaceae bacterium]MDA9887432.1 bifunctional 4-hydroxy-2-oxoglutarate aldolase/2-dehydro-3-deoxy-phosphogluconate aldolase [Flavobacteriaceae bacterium]MDA9984844.1 bifunctional 4-hydroxy-2-oxoglutarate aldolase/2-dehydro-3-deoxy-phosphogluconate aldolase [Flavob